MSLQTILSTLAPGLLVRGNIVETGVEVYPPLLEIVICYGGEKSNSPFYQKVHTSGKNSRESKTSQYSLKSIIFKKRLCADKVTSRNVVNISMKPLKMTGKGAVVLQGLMWRVRGFLTQTGEEDLKHLHKLAQCWL